ncbi:MAG: siphovirus ReqiPepy6 Gp37-like family protein [Eubacteriales bacterium]|nr:siphovirus ReqiPepy6 Gp37-like family protein [Eubacteriales bacterium]
MIEIRIYDSDLNWVDVIRNVNSVQFKRELYGVGSFEIHVSLNIKGALSLCKLNNIIVINNEVKKVGIVRDFNLNETRQGLELTVYGVTLDGLLQQRIVVPPTKVQDSNALGWEKIQGNAETVIKHFINKNMVSPFDENRKFKNMIIAKNTNFDKTFPWKARYSNLAEELENICSYAEIGYSITVDLKNKQFVFDIIKGIDRTRKQSEVSPVVFRTEYSNIGEYTYTEENKDFKNTGYAGGYGEDENRLIYILGAENKDINRFETFLDCANSDNIDDLKFYGEQKMTDLKPKKNIEVFALPKTFKFEEDYFLGDKVTIFINRLGIEIDTIITSVTEVWEREVGYNCEICFGDKVPNIFSIQNRKELIR